MFLTFVPMRKYGSFEMGALRRRFGESKSAGAVQTVRQDGGLECTFSLSLFSGPHSCPYFLP